MSIMFEGNILDRNTIAAAVNEYVREMNVVIITIIINQAC
jgi:hypothetical protein